MKPNRYPRPASVTIFSALLLVNALVGLGAVGHIFLYEPEIRGDPLFMTFAIVTPILTGSMGFFMLRGAHWARVLFLFLMIPVMVVFGIYNEGPAALPRLFITVLLSLLLLTKGANQFFLGRRTWFEPKEPRDRNEPTEAPQEQRSQRRGKYDF